MDVREKLVGLLATTSLNFEKVVYLADYLVKNGVTVQEWIPGVPPKKGDYLCYFKYEPQMPDAVCENTYFGSGRWMSDGDKVTHWMPLPEAPKTNEVNDGKT